MSATRVVNAQRTMTCGLWWPSCWTVLILDGFHTFACISPSWVQAVPAEPVIVGSMGGDICREDSWMRDFRVIKDPVFVHSSSCVSGGKPDGRASVVRSRLIDFH